ncbi:MAG: hypothetical protein QW561_00100 [Candidatus Aenigmatarchaeota archaeon]
MRQTCKSLPDNLTVHIVSEPDEETFLEVLKYIVNYRSPRPVENPPHHPEPLDTKVSPGY